MSVSLDALKSLAANFNGGIFRLSPENLAVFFWTSNYLERRRNWLDYRVNPLDEVTDAQWDEIQAMVSSALRTIKMPILGTIFPFATQDPPPNVLPCDGATYLRVDFPDLYAVIDPFFIVDADRFSVPDLRSRTILGVGSPAGLSSYNVGDIGGEEKHQLTESELAGHVHSIPLTATTLAVEPGEVTVLTPIPILTASTGSTGGDSPHNNMQPYYALNYGIVAS